MALPDLLPRYTPEEYLVMERKADYKSEYIDGYIYPMSGIAPYGMSGGTPEHSLIKGALIHTAIVQLSGKPCRTYDCDMQVRVDPGMYTYPDATVVCGESQFDEFKNLLNPTVIFEVLSPTTEAYDRGEKFNRYQRIPSLRQIVFVNQSAPRIEVFSRQPGDAWTFSQATGPDASIELESIGCSLPLKDVYCQVSFDVDASTKDPSGRTSGGR